MKSFKQNGYDYANGETIHRKYDEVLLETDMKTFESPLSRCYDLELEKIINKIKYVASTPLYMGNREAFYLVNEGFNLIRDDADKEPIHIEYIDFENPENNILR